MNTRLALAVLAAGSLGFGAGAQADPFVGRLIGSVAAGMLVNGAIKNHDRKFAAQCRLYDREGMEVYLPCDSRRPLGEVLTQGRPDAMADGLAGGPSIEVAPLAAPAAAYAENGFHERYPSEAGYAPAAAHPAPPLDEYCRCEGASHGAGRVAEVYDAYGASSSSSVSYSESYGGGYGAGYANGGGYGYGYSSSGGFYPYGGAGYGAGGYAQWPVRAAGRDASGFLTWPGKRVR